MQGTAGGDSPEVAATRPVRQQPQHSPTFASVAGREWDALMAELHGVQDTMPAQQRPSDDALCQAILEYLREWGGWRAGSAIVGCRLSDRAGITICEVPGGNAGWALLRRLVKEGRLEERQRVRGRRDFYSVFRVPPGT